MAFGIYIHIPYCLQRCSYCDFATVGWGQSVPPQRYYELLRQELSLRAPLAPTTPSLVGPEFIVGILNEIRNHGFHLVPDVEITIEVNPATIDLHQLALYQRGGVNRFSVGAQTFSEVHLKKTGRHHSVADTRETLRLLSAEKMIYSFDLLFGLPAQTLEEVRADVAEALSFAPDHLSAYCLTVDDKHPMAVGRADDDEQVQMFEMIQAELQIANLIRYEISNFAQPGHESRHNLLYWTDQPYLGLGHSAHSYLPSAGRWGTRFWNASAIGEYARQVEAAHHKSAWPLVELPSSQYEPLRLHQALTDFAHTSLRLMRGLRRDDLKRKFAPLVVAWMEQRLIEVTNEGLLIPTSSGYTLSRRGRVLSNLAFERLTVLESDLSAVDNLNFAPIFETYD
jgi:oxygen-independent coproporphyrinogen-3 oxidase